MEGKKTLVWRLRAPTELELACQLTQEGIQLFYERILLGEVTSRVPITPEKADQLFFGLMSQGWHTE